MKKTIQKTIILLLALILMLANLPWIVAPTYAEETEKVETFETIDDYLQKYGKEALEDEYGKPKNEITKMNIEAEQEVVGEYGDYEIVPINIKDWSGLYTYTGLINLRIADIDGELNLDFQRFKCLKNLSISDCNLYNGGSDLNGLENLEELLLFQISNTENINLSLLKKLKNLEIISTVMDNTDWISNCVNLEKLQLWWVTIKQGNIYDLRDMENLKEVIMCPEYFGGDYVLKINGCKNLEKLELIGRRYDIRWRRRLCCTNRD